MIPAALIAIVAALALGAWLLLRRRAVWTAETDGRDYGTKVDAATGSFAFPIAPNSVHYLTKLCAGLANAKGLRLRYRIAADPAVEFQLMQQIGGVEQPVPGSVGLAPVLYFQRRGDNWSGAGEFETYRWWATFNPPQPLGPGEFEIVAPFDQRWTAVESSNSIDHAEAFRAALADAARVGATFPGLTGEGHGCCASGPAIFTMLEFAISSA